MTEEKLQGAIDLINEVSGTSFQLERNDSWSWSLIADWWNVIADWDLEQIWRILVLEAKDLFNN